MNNIEVDKALKNQLDYIRDFYNGYKHTTNDVWGKNVLLLNPDGTTFKCELGNWYIHLPWKEEYNFEQFVETFRYLAKQREWDEICNFKNIPENKGMPDEEIVIEQLCDWQFLEDDDGKIITKEGFATLVKYAVVVHKPKEQ